MNKTGRVSILTPAYNAQATIARAIQSVLNQSYPHFEYIIVNDASTDNTEEVILKFTDRRIRYNKLSTNQGQPTALNEALKVARGDYIAFLDSDDAWLPEKLERQLKAFKAADSAVGLIYTNGYRIVNGGSQQLDIADDSPSRVVYQHKEKKKSLFPARIEYSCNSSWMIKKEVYEKIGGFDKSLLTMHDLGYFVEAAKEFDIYFLNEALAIWHHDGDHLSTITKKHLECKEYFYQKYKPMIKKDRKYRYDHHRALAREWNRHKVRGKALKNWAQAACLRPSNVKIYWKMNRSFWMMLIEAAQRVFQK